MREMEQVLLLQELGGPSPSSFRSPLLPILAFPKASLASFLCDFSYFVLCLVCSSGSQHPCFEYFRASCLALLPAVCRPSSLSYLGRQILQNDYFYPVLSCSEPLGTVITIEESTLQRPQAQAPVSVSPSHLTRVIPRDMNAGCAAGLGIKSCPSQSRAV